MKIGLAISLVRVRGGSVSLIAPGVISPLLTIARAQTGGAVASGDVP